MTDKPRPAWADELDGFTGTEEYHRWSILFPYVMTDGAKYLADNAGAYWLMDAIASWQTDTKVKREPFQVWELLHFKETEVEREHWELTCDDGNDHMRTKQVIEYSDFPMESIKLYFIEGVILLPSEY
jgi:hypothetical protein